MGQIHIRCYAELNDRLPPERRFRDSSLAWEREAVLTDLMAALGIPAAEVDLVLVNGESVPLEAPVRPGDRIALYPVFESFDIGPTQRIRGRPLRQPRFILDVHLGKLAAHLRMLGFDASGGGVSEDDALAERSIAEGRILLTRDRLLAARRDLSRVFLLRSGEPGEQLVAVVRRFQLQELVRPFTRCLRCNSPLTPVSKEEVFERLPPRVRQRQTEFHRCCLCPRVYWPGSHQERMSSLVEQVRHIDFQ
jgi:uncharacterized protein with PIN domain/sulfur carrier protein ThiS